MKNIVIKPIGVIHSPYKKLEGMPIQAYRSDKSGKIELYKKYKKGLQDIEGFSHLIILYQFHRAKPYSLLKSPFLDDRPRGVFAMRGPSRPNYIGISIIKLIKVTGNILKVGNIDVLDGTPLLDIKPYVKKFDTRKNVKIGWLKGKI